MLFFALIIVTGLFLQMLLAGAFVAFDIEQLTILPTVIVAAWYARRGKVFQAFASAFILALFAAAMGGGTRGITLLSMFSATGVAVLLRHPLRRPTWVLRFIHYTVSAFVAVGIFATLIPLFGVGQGYGAIFLHVGLLSAVLTGLASFPIQGLLDRIQPILRNDAPGQNLLR